MEKSFGTPRRKDPDLVDTGDAIDSRGDTMSVSLILQWSLAVLITPGDYEN